MNNTLNLTRKYKGYYVVESGDIKITISNPLISSGMGDYIWQLVIEEDGDDGFLVNEFFNTKKEAVKFGTKWVINNL